MFLLFPGVCSSANVQFFFLSCEGGVGLEQWTVAYRGARVSFFFNFVNFAMTNSAFVYFTVILKKKFFKAIFSDCIEEIVLVAKCHPNFVVF